MEWTKPMKEYFCTAVRQGRTDKEMVQVMNSLYPGKWTVYAMRSQRGRLERKGVLQRGLSGSSKMKETRMAKRRVKKELWTQEAARRAHVLRGSGKAFHTIASALKREGLRRDYNQKAVYDLLRKVQRGAIQLIRLPHAKPVQLSFVKPAKPNISEEYRPCRSGTCRVWLTAKNGTNLQFEVPDEAFAAITSLCCKVALSLPIKGLEV